MKFSDWRSGRADAPFLSSDTCDALISEAAAAKRRRAHLLLHESHADPVQRLAVAFAQGTYIQPHRHPAQWEMVLPVRGTLALLLFSEGGELTGRVELTPASVPAVQIAAGTWHTLIALTPQALMVEFKPGPFRPSEFLSLFPAEDTPDADRATRWFATASTGARWREA